MAFMTWGSQYSVGVKKMDEQHTAMIEMLNDLHDAMMKGQAVTGHGPLLRRLLDYTRDHFSDEEALMSAAGFPGFADHCARHRKLTSEVVEFEARLDRADPAAHLDLLNFLRAWIGVHILQEDHEYGPWLNLHGVR